MMVRCILFILVSIGARAADVGAADHMIACDPRDEHFVSEAFDAIQTLIGSRELKKGSLQFSQRVATCRPDYIIVGRGFYISPNELRGFELVIPSECLTEKDGVFTLTETVIVSGDETRSGIRILLLKKRDR